MGDQQMQTTTAISNTCRGNEIIGKHLKSSYQLQTAIKGKPPLPEQLNFSSPVG